MSLTIHNCEQGSPEWYAVRAGVPSASEFATVLASGKGGAPSKTRRDYILTLIGERLTPTQAERYTNAAMERGKEMEAEARKAYQFLNDAELTPVGFMQLATPNCGASPDSLVGSDGLLEIKTKIPKLLFDCRLQNPPRLPPEHVAQVQGQLMVSGRQWVDFFAYWPGLKPFQIRVQRDEAYIARLRIEIADFNTELNTLMEQLQ